MIIINNKIIAGDGMTLTNGDAFGKVVYLASGDNVSEWYEITDEEAAQMTSDPAEEADYIAQLERFGVE